MKRFARKDVAAPISIYKNTWELIAKCEVKAGREKLSLLLRKHGSSTQRYHMADTNGKIQRYLDPYANENPISP